MRREGEGKNKQTKAERVRMKRIVPYIWREVRSGAHDVTHYKVSEIVRERNERVSLRKGDQFGDEVEWKKRQVVDFVQIEKFNLRQR